MSKRNMEEIDAALARLEEEAKKAEESKKSKKGNVVRYVAGFMAGVITLTCGHFIGKKIKSSIEENKTEDVTTSISETIEITDDNALNIKFRQFLENKGIITCETMPSGKVAIVLLTPELNSNEIAVLVQEFFTDELFKELLGDLNTEIVELTDEEKVDFAVRYLKEIGVNIPVADISQDILNIITPDEELTTENFEELVVRLATPYVENNLSVSTEDLTKFTGIMLIDRLAEENPELVQQLFSVQSEEEFLNDAGKVIGNTYMYDHNIWKNEKTTENFIWISEGIPDNDPQKEKMQLIENYVRRIAVAAANDDAEEVNRITAELIEALTSPTGSLNALDDGTEFAAQIYWALINNSIGRNYLSQEHRDFFNVRSTSETNISNILTVIRGCLGEFKKRVLGQ